MTTEQNNTKQLTDQELDQVAAGRRRETFREQPTPRRVSASEPKTYSHRVSLKWWDVFTGS